MHMKRGGAKTSKKHCKNLLQKKKKNALVGDVFEEKRNENEQANLSGIEPPARRFLQKIRRSAGGGPSKKASDDKSRWISEEKRGKISRTPLVERTF